MINYDLYIDGKWMASTGSSRIEVEDPATRQVIGSVPRGTKEDVDKAVAAAKKAFPEWSRTSAKERGRILRKVGDLMEQRKTDFARVISLELGMPIRHVEKWHLKSSIREAVYFAHMAENFEYEYEAEGGWVRREPFGVIAGLTPWNYPMEQITMKLFPAIAAGNCVVLKPSQATPLCACMLANIFEDAGLPPGVFNIVTGAGGEVGNCLALHRDVDMLTFTGSTSAGKEVGALALSTVKKITLELGGKSPLIVLPDADFRAAAEEAVYSVFMNTGQTCCAYTRMLVPRKNKEEIESFLAEEAGRYKVGAPSDPDSDIGPLISKRAFERVKGYIEKGIEEGARMLVGEVPGEIKKGYYVKPVIFTDVTNDMTIAREEIFGPVLSVISYDTVEEAVEIANDTPYGLDSAVYGPAEEAYEVGCRIRAGGVHINGADAHITCPFGGYKESGLGREGGTFGFEEYLEVKSVFGK
ncbi:aldehyde dehydrogenase family protein [Anaerovorax odorimutans]|uniref:aldehyde dehydrogenase (NAD(+)) n=1 Tax=Anaerovorax odorimutans TaxID=109327 RepID=A0ABT1RTC9_9FIRM|nr:aldehyde dehydrogenase family protein [Anaerovorax odorimutans]MCQ4638438.1 aldehyde dehydrogenase family protein [Anaerovorax odorimutans]